MTQRIKKRKRKSYKKILGFLFFVIFLFVLIRPIFVIGYRKLETVRPKMTTYKDIIRGQGYTILNQDQFYAKHDGTVVYGAQEGERVPVDYEIVTVNFQDDFSHYKDESIRIQAAIDYKSNKKSANDDSYMQTPEVINIIEKIQDSIQKDDYQALMSNITTLDLATPHNVSISELSELLNEPIEVLEEKKEKLLNDLSETRSVFISKMPGVISYIFPAGDKLDYNGSFDKFTIKYLDQLTFNKRQQSGVKIKKNQPIFRIVDNLQWYVAVTVHNNKKIGQLKVGDSVNLVLNKKEPIKGSIHEIKSDDNKEGVLIIKMEEGFEENYREGKQKAEIVLNHEDAYTLPTSALVEQNKTTGVYVQDLHNLVRFVPVVLIAQNDNWAYVKKGDMKNKLKVDEKEISTINYEDNIVVDPGAVQRKQLIN